MQKSGVKKYGMGSNVLFMVKEAASSVPSVLYLVLLQAVLAVWISLLELFVTPVLLGKIQIHAPLEEILLLLGGFVGGILLLRALSAYVDRNVKPGRIEVRINLIGRIVQKTAACSYPLIAGKEMQNKQSKTWEAVSGNYSAGEAVWETLCGLLKSIMGFLIYLLLLKDVSLFLILVTMFTAILGYFATNYIGHWEYRHRKEKADYFQKMFYLQGKSKDRIFAKDIRIFGMEGWLRSLTDKYQRLLVDFIGKGRRKYFFGEVIDLLLAFLRNGIAYGYLLMITLQGGLGLPQFLLLFNAAGGFTEWVSQIMERFTHLHRQCLELSTVREFLDEKEIFQMEGGISPGPAEGNSYTIELKDVTFSYQESEKPVFEHLNLTIKAGEKLAVVGLNGAGKTTLVKLICGFYDPTEGEVLLNGVNIKEFNRREYYQLFAGVFQDFSVLAGSILLNITQDGQQADKDRALACLEKAGLLDKVNSLPKGIDSLIEKSVFNDAIELSGGELQRLMLARLLYRDSPMVVLDEPTAALDALAESDIYNRYQELTRGRTSIYISHRLASTRFCDRIILLQEGKIAEEGTHEELMAKGGGYRNLFQLQSKYYKEEAEGGKEM